MCIWHSIQATQNIFSCSFNFQTIRTRIVRTFQHEMKLFFESSGSGWTVAGWLFAYFFFSLYSFYCKRNSNSNFLLWNFICCEREQQSLENRLHYGYYHRDWIAFVVKERLEWIRIYLICLLSVLCAHNSYTI